MPEFHGPQKQKTRFFGRPSISSVAPFQCDPVSVISIKPAGTPSCSIPVAVPDLAIAADSAEIVGAVGAKLKSLEGRLWELAVFKKEEPAPIDWHPNAVNIYKRKIADLSAALSADDIVRDEAATALRGLVDKIAAYPVEKRGQFELELQGQLAAALKLAKYGNDGGGRGIRTLVTVSRKHAFQACALSHSATPPRCRRAEPADRADVPERARPWQPPRQLQRMVKKSTGCSCANHDACC
jgi:hypothetical protein